MSVKPTAVTEVEQAGRSDKAKTLSNAAKATLWCLFRNEGSSVKLDNEESTWSDTAKRAVDELIDHGIIWMNSRLGSKWEVYRLTEKGQGMNRRQSLAFIDKHGRFSIWKKI